MFATVGCLAALLVAGFVVVVATSALEPLARRVGIPERFPGLLVIAVLAAFAGSQSGSSLPPLLRALGLVARGVRSWCSRR